MLSGSEKPDDFGKIMEEGTIKVEGAGARYADSGCVVTELL